MLSLQHCLFAALAVATVHGYQTFQDRIPNGDMVPNPCDRTAIWGGVGHLDPQGGGHLNPFGEDFWLASKFWTEELCRKDSDGDHKTNGEELGDPNCQWTLPGDPVGHVTGHPGICEPLHSDACRAQGISCDSLTPVGK